MNVIDHGRWAPYKLTKPRKDFPHNALYARRQGDRRDWYDYIHGEAAAKHFTRGNIVATACWRGDLKVFLIGAATRDVSTLFPGADCLVLEIEGYTGKDPQADLGGKAYDPDTKTFEDYKFPVAPGSTVDLQNQIDELREMLAKMRQ